jgi:hypothetical protein
VYFWYELKLKFIVFFIALNAIGIPLLIMGLFEINLFTLAAVSFYYLIGFLIIYNRFWLGKKAKYPLTYPSGEPDIYFPRTNIPRPIYADAREYSKTPSVLEKQKLDDGKG